MKEQSRAVVSPQRHPSTHRHRGTVVKQQHGNEKDKESSTKRERERETTTTTTHLCNPLHIQHKQSVRQAGNPSAPNNPSTVGVFTFLLLSLFVPLSFEDSKRPAIFDLGGPVPVRPSCLVPCSLPQDQSRHTRPTTARCSFAYTDRQPPMRQAIFLFDPLDDLLSRCPVFTVPKVGADM